jgi:hypothetical protein
MAKRYNFLTRCLAAVALLFLYGRGWGYRGYYAPRAYYGYGPRCYFSYRWGRTICRY